MMLKLVVDMNLSPDWVAALAQHGYSTVHWSAVGDPRATDATIMAWALSNSHVVFTHDLDFGTLLAATHASGPSVIQLRTRDVMPAACLGLMVSALRQHLNDLLAGALVVVDEAASRVRVLPI